MNEAVQVPAHRREALAAIAARLERASSIALTTHVNADGDGTGCEAALAAWLESLGKTVAIVNPTPYPDGFRHLLENEAWIVDPGTVRTTVALDGADVLVVVDTSERSRIGRIANGLNGRETVVIDHHLPSDDPIQGLVLQDDTACATGELIYDLLVVAGMARPWPVSISRAIYTAILTDTGSFRFSNTSARAHAIAGDLLAMGVDPEAVYRTVYGSVPLQRIHLLRRALENLEVDADFPITWITLDRASMSGATGEDLEGVVDHARSVEGTEVALLFRETADGSTKVSLRSSGDTNVNVIARQFGGGGHAKASGALVPEPPADVIPRILDATRAAIREQLPAFRGAGGNG